MSETYASIRLGGEAGNVERLGTFVAWLVVNNLLSTNLERAYGSAAVRVRLQDLTGAEFLTTVLHGELKSEHLNELGQKFTESYFVSGDFDVDFERCEYEGEDDWVRYEEVSPLITRAFKAFKSPEPAARIAKVIRFPSWRRK